MSGPGTPDGPLPVRLPPETPTERIRELLVELEGTNDGRIATVLASIAAVSPTSSGLTMLVDAVAPWLGEFGRQRYRERLEHILWWLVDAIDRMAIEPEARPDVADWGELVLTVLPMALRARAEKKREAFGALLANGLRQEAPADRDEGRTMAIILDQLEYEHIEALADVSNLPRSLSLDMFWGYRSEASLDRRLISSPSPWASSQAT